METVEMAEISRLRDAVVDRQMETTEMSHVFPLPL
jgi:hypothetical protein